MRRVHLLLAATVVLTLSAGCLNTTFPKAASQDNYNQTRDALSNSTSVSGKSIEKIDGETRTGVIAYNASSDTLSFTQTVNDTRVFATYETPTRTYRWSDGNATFVKEENQTLERLSGSLFIDSFVPFYNYTVPMTGTTTFNGREVGVYRATGDKAEAILRRDGAENPSNATMTTYLTKEGRIIYQSFETDRGSFTATLTDINSTVVEEPEWTENATREEEEEPDPPRAGVSFEATANGTVAVTVTDPGNVDRIRVETKSGAFMETTSNRTAVITEPEAGDTVTVRLVADDYAVENGDQFVVVGIVNGRQDVVGVYETA